MNVAQRRTVRTILAISAMITLAACDPDGDPDFDLAGETGVAADEPVGGPADLPFETDVDPEVRHGKKGKKGKKAHRKYQKWLAKKVRREARKQGLEPMPRAPKVRPRLAELGKALAFDKELSGNRDISCMTCHHPNLSSDDDLSLSIGVGGVGLGTDRVHPHDIFIPRNAPGLFNMHDLDVMFWDGRVNDVHGAPLDTPATTHITPEMEQVFEFGALSAQAMFPVTSRAEMRGAVGTNELAMVRDDDFTSQWDALMARLGAIPAYVDMFEKAYPGTKFEDMSFAHAANAIAAFEVAGFEARNTPWDELLRGDNYAMDIDALKGARDFLGDAKCSSCHNGSSLSDQDFHNTALPQFGPGKNDGDTLSDDWGRYNETGDPDHFYDFRTSPLRNVELTGPYGHAGQFVELEDFVRHYIDPETSLRNYDVTQIDPLLQPTLLPTEDAVWRNVDALIASPTFTDTDDRVDDMMAFMHALTDPDSLDLLDQVPASVPSGLPVEDDVLVTPANRAGVLELDFELPGSAFREFQFYTQEMCDGGGTGTITFDENANTLAIDVSLDGLPYRPTACYDYNPSTDYNQYPDCVSNGKWQLWFVPRMFNRFTTFYYDLSDGRLLGSEFDNLTLPPNVLPVTLPSLQMLCSDFFESDPVTLHAEHHEEYVYDHLLDMEGTAGTIFALAPKNIFNPLSLEAYYVDGGLPASEAMSFADFIELNNEGKGGVAVAMSYEPFPKPSYLKSRDNLMLGFAASWPNPTGIDNIEYEPPVECGTNFQWPAPGVGFDPGPLP